jgi:hypothetical protein
MSTDEFNGPDANRSRLRAILATIEKEIGRLPTTDAEDSTSPRHGLLAAVASLSSQLALGPEPEVRSCPTCHKIGMRAASVCGFCWTKLTPPADSHARA